MGEEEAFTSSYNCSGLMRAHPKKGGGGEGKGRTFVVQWANDVNRADRSAFSPGVRGIGKRERASCHHAGTHSLRPPGI